MTSFLIRLFVRHPEQTELAETRTAYGKLAGITGLVCNLLLCAAKVVAGILSGSLSMMADAINNLSDSGSAAVTYFGFRLAGKAADAEHPYGHARIEYLTALAISLLILLVGVELAKTSIDRILHPVSTSFSVLSVLILAGSILLKLWMAHFQRTLGRRIDSAALQATADDSRNDVLATGAVLFASVLEVLTGWRADGYFGLLVALFILRNGYEIGKETVNTLLGTAPDPKLVKRIAEEILSHDKVLGIHDLMVHDYGPGRRFASVHAELDSKEPVLACHDLIDEIDRRAYDMCIQERLYREGKLKKRTNHCDTKVNNMLFDAVTDKVLCVIDLDTVMPGFVLSDIGDFIRTGANTGAEDDENLDNVGVNMEIFKAYTRGYMEKAKSFLTPTEIKLLPYGGRLLTYMQTVRFLTDYINGDTYYKIHYPTHNLVRTKAQFKLLQSLEAHAEEMDAFMNEWL